MNPNVKKYKVINNSQILDFIFDFSDFWESSTFKPMSNSNSVNQNT